MAERIDVERAVKESADLARLSAEQVSVALAQLAAYRRGFATGHDGSGDAQSRTEALALAGPDQIDLDRRRLEREVEIALRALRTVFNIVARYKASLMPKRATAGATPESSADPDMWCTCCLRVGHLEPRATGRYRELCRWCGDFQAVQGQLPPEVLLSAHHRGTRLSAAMVAQALAPPPPSMKGKRKKKARRKVA